MKYVIRDTKPEHLTDAAAILRIHAHRVERIGTYRGIALWDQSKGIRWYLYRTKTTTVVQAQY